mmetsp:Transcript_47867/g.116459  ORF Transcript_47867/g.116459 Transcript_47867/m.116459 type:complete len:128 (-) Transcript_47867:100-483(-)
MFKKEQIYFVETHQAWYLITHMESNIHREDGKKTTKAKKKLMTASMRRRGSNQISIHGLKLYQFHEIVLPGREGDQLRRNLCRRSDDLGRASILRASCRSERPDKKDLTFRPDDPFQQIHAAQEGTS